MLSRRYIGNLFSSKCSVLLQLYCSCWTVFGNMNVVLYFDIFSGCSKETYDWCAFWSSPIWRIGLVSRCCSSITPFGKIGSCSSMGFTIAHFLHRIAGHQKFKLSIRFLKRMCAFEILTIYSVFCFQGSPDLKAGREVADYLGTRHHEFQFTVQV